MLRKFVSLVTAMRYADKMIGQGRGLLQRSGQFDGVEWRRHYRA